MKKYVVYGLAFLVAVCINYLIRKSVGLSINPFVVLRPGVFGFMVVWMIMITKRNKSL